MHEWANKTRPTTSGPPDCVWSRACYVSALIDNDDDQTTIYGEFVCRRESPSISPASFIYLVSSQLRLKYVPLFHQTLTCAHVVKLTDRPHIIRAAGDHLVGVIWIHLNNNYTESIVACRAEWVFLLPRCCFADFYRRRGDKCFRIVCVSLCKTHTQRHTNRNRVNLTLSETRVTGLHLRRWGEGHDQNINQLDFCDDFDSLPLLCRNCLSP